MADRLKSPAGYVMMDEQKGLYGLKCSMNRRDSMEIKRDSYLRQLISYRLDGLVKVITGIRRCGFVQYDPVLYRASGGCLSVFGEQTL